LTLSSDFVFRHPLRLCARSFSIPTDKLTWRGALNSRSDTHLQNSELHRFDCGRRLRRDIVRDADDAGYIANNIVGQFFKRFEWETCRCRGPRVDALPASQLDLLAEIPLAFSHAGHAIFMKNSHVLESTGVFQQPLHNDGCFADCLDALWGGLSYHTRRKRRTREGDAFKQFGRKTQRFSDHSDTVFAKLYQRLNNLIAEGFLWINAKLFEDIVLPLDPCNSFIHVCQNGSLKQMFGTTFFDNTSEDSAIKGLSNRFPLFFRVRDALECRKKLLLSIDDFNGKGWNKIKMAIIDMICT